jgi:hypothetical protein
MLDVHLDTPGPSAWRTRNLCHRFRPRACLLFGIFEKTNGRVDFSQYYSLQTAGGAPPQSQNLAVNGTTGRLLVSREMLDEQQATIHAPQGLTLYLRCRSRHSHGPDLLTRHRHSIGSVTVPHARVHTQNRRSKIICVSQFNILQVSYSDFHSVLRERLRYRE